MAVAELDFVSAFRDHARNTPDRTAVLFCHSVGNGLAEQALTYAELDLAARSRAAVLLSRVRPGERVLLLYPTGVEFAVTFLACLYAQVVPVAAPVPSGQVLADGRATAIAADAAVGLVLTEESSRVPVTQWLAGCGLDLPSLVTGADPADGFTPPPPRPDALAFLQYTSGSTSEPKGVSISRDNLAHNLEVGRRLVGWSAETPFCSWLPMFHDMGLIAMLLTPLYLGTTTVVFPPNDFLKRPQLWLQLIDRYRIQVSGAPNFAYELCARKVTDEQLAGLDLSGWRYACNGAEPIDPATLDRFAARFAGAGFRPETFVPGYGLAETTLFVTGAPTGRAPVRTVADTACLERDLLRPAEAGAPGTVLVSCGVPAGLEVRIVDPASASPLPAGEVGEIWVAGRSVAQGYWRNEAATLETFAARTAGGDGPYLRTGDLGAVHDGELYITGRLKEMLIIRGRNLYPHDIEREVAGLDAAFAGLPCAVFSVPAAVEEVVVVQELRARGRTEAEIAALAARVRVELGRSLGVRITNVVFVRLGRVRRTSSGKIRRGLMRKLFCAGRLETVYEHLDAETRRRYRPEPVAAGEVHDADA